jgi:putative ABC transport system permease protein
MDWFRRTQLAWHVLHKGKVRLLVALVGICFADMLILMQLGFKGALFYSCGVIHRSLRGDLCLASPHFETLVSPQSFRRELLYRCRALPEVRGVHGVKLGLQPWRNPETGRKRNIQVIGFEPSSPIFNNSEVIAQASKLKSLRAVLFDRLGRPEFGDIPKLLKKGPVVTEVYRRQVQVAGLFSLGASFAADGNMICSEQTFTTIFPDSKREEVEMGLIFLRAGSDIGKVQKQLQAMMGDAVVVLSRQQLEMLEENYWANSTGIGFIFSLGAVMGFFVGVVIVYQILHGDVSDHLPQYATLKAMGYGNGYLLTTLAQESLLLAFLGYVPGLLVAVFLYEKTAQATSLPIFMTWERAVGTLVATIAMCTISAAIAARKLTSADPAEIF